MNEKDQSIEVIPEKKPNEQVGFFFSSSIKITDPNTNEILIQMRAD
jgi:hypothetical protein